jgi:signal transduction histidine kinase/DNA-binding response OmpR family regulator/tetratricopeptide (TPR) repeat protein
MIYKKTILLLFIICTSLSGFSQNVDSLEKILLTPNISVKHKVNTWISLAEVLRQKNVEKANNYLEQAIELSEQKGFKNLIANANMVKVRILAYAREIEPAINLTTNTLKHYQTTHDTIGILNCYNTLGILYKMNEEVETAIKIYKKGIILSKNKPSLNAQLLVNLSNAQQILGDFSAATRTSFQALELLKKYGSPKTIALLYNNIGLLYNNQKDYKKALKYYQLSLSDKENINEFGQINAHINIADVQISLGNDEAAYEAYKVALAISEKIGYQQYIIASKVNIALYYAEHQEDAKAKQILQTLDTLQSKMRDTDLSHFYTIKSVLYENKGQLNLALKENKKALALSEANEDILQLSKDLGRMSDLYKMTGNYKAAYNYLIRYKSLNDSIINQDKLIELKLQQAEYEYNQEKLVRNKIFETEQKLAQETIRKSRLLNWIIGLLVILFSGIAFLFYSLYKQRQFFSKELENKNNELINKNESLEKLDTAKTNFFANISHELKTPLTLIINPIRKLLTRANISNEEAYLLKSAEKNSLQLFDLTNQILELTKFDVNKVDINNTAFNFPDLLYKTYADFESLAVSRKLGFLIDYKGQKDLTIESDSYKIHTILKNLISNAIKFSNENNQITIFGIEKEKHLEISISDTGQGIHPNDLPNIFDRYYQAKISEKISSGGTGIGLAICNEYAKLLGGTVKATSEYGKGSTFTVILPKNVTKETISTDFKTPKATTYIPVNVLKKEETAHLPTILLVEDNLDMQSYIQLILSPSFNLLIANHGEEALDILKDQYQSIQLIISDVMMPVMNGHELLERLKADVKYTSIPVVMLTALSDMSDKLKALKVGIDDYLVKPFVDDELLARIDNLIQNAEQRKAYRNSLIVATSTETLAPETPSAKDVDFLKALEEEVLKNYKNTNFSVETLSYGLQLSRAQVYRRVKSAVGLTPGQYIDQVRYQESKKILEQNKYYTIKAVALSVGFKDEKNFSRNFKKRFGKYPFNRANE